MDDVEQYDGGRKAAGTESTRITANALGVHALISSWASIVVEYPVRPVTSYEQCENANRKCLFVSGSKLKMLVGGVLIVCFFASLAHL